MQQLINFSIKTSSKMSLEQRFSQLQSLQLWISLELRGKMHQIHSPYRKRQSLRCEIIGINLSDMLKRLSCKHEWKMRPD
jgi:hypothetical protein